MQYTFMGIPCVYYGDEAGLQGLKDPYCRACFDWNNINQDINDWYKLLGKLRLKKALSGGEFNLKKADDGVVIYERVSQDSKVLVAINKSDTNYVLAVKDKLINYITKEQCTKEVVIKPNDFVVLVN